MLKTIVTLLLCGLTLPLFAETCPLAIQLNHYQQEGWRAYDSDNGLPLSAKREARFRNMATEFVLAEWSANKHQNAIHCYYRDKNGSNLEAYLGKTNFIPTPTNHYWYAVSGFRQCAAKQTLCQFRRELG